jgi:hypothetical protein
LNMAAIEPLNVDEVQEAINWSQRELVNPLRAHSVRFQRPRWQRLKPWMRH